MTLTTIRTIAVAIGTVGVIHSILTENGPAACWAAAYICISIASLMREP